MKIAVYDAAETSFVGLTWRFGAQFHKMGGHFQHVVAARSWASALDACIDFTTDNVVDEIQFWGHGNPGGAFINKQALDVSKEHKTRLFTLGAMLEPNALFWLRTCASFAGAQGHAFASRFAATLDRRVAGSTHNIGFPWHSGQHSVRPGKTPDWSISEGLSRLGQPLESARHAPNTLPFSKMSLPPTW